MGDGTARHRPRMPNERKHEPGDFSDLTELSRAILRAEEPVPVDTPRRDERSVDWSQVRSLRVPALVAQALLALSVVASAVALWVNVEQRSLLNRAASRPSAAVFSDLLDLNDTIDTLNVVLIALFVLTGFAFITWLALAYANLGALHLEPRYSVGWAVGGWFVPVLGLWRPKQVVDDVWRSVDARRGDDGMGTPPRSLLVGTWWFVWIAAFIAALKVRSGDDVTTVDEALSTNLGHLFRSGLLVVAGILAMLVVRAVTRSQSRPTD